MNENKLKELAVEYLSGQLDVTRVTYALSESAKQRCPISLIDASLVDDIQKHLDEFGENHELESGWWAELNLDIDDWICDVVDANLPKF